MKHRYLLSVVCLFLVAVSLRCAGGGDDGIDDDSSPNPPADLDQDGVPAGLDCDDTNPEVYPGADPVCEVDDSNCDGLLDESPDVDGDGYPRCPMDDSPADCDDTDAAIHPMADEVCDGIDNNCDRTVDEGFDEDMDGITTCAEPVPDCNDEDPLINPAVVEQCDSVDNDCDGDIDEVEDNDGDGFTNCSQPEPDCDDNNPNVAPTAPEQCDGLDNDCDGEVDENYNQDQDAFTTCSEQPDCNDKDPQIYPGAMEVCDNEVDENCDGVAATTGDMDADGFDDCAVDDPDCNDTNAAVWPGAEELCDFIDNDCNGLIDDGVGSDIHEPNDTPDEASDVGTPDETEILVYGALNIASDEDWYKFCSTGSEKGSSVIEISLEDIPANGDYDLYFFREDDFSKPLASSERGGGQNEEISYGGETQRSETVWYYVQVVWRKGAYGCPSYQLHIGVR